MFSDFTYSITSGPAEITINPVIDSLVFSGEEDEDLGAYVRRVETEFVLTGSDYSTLYDNWESAGLFADLPFNISLNNSNYYTGILRIGSPSIRWDVSNCRARATVDPSGAWLCAQERWKDEINILSGPARVSTSYYTGTIEETSCITSRIDTDPDYADTSPITTCITSGAGWVLYKHIVEEVFGVGLDPDQRTLFSDYVREVITVGCDGGSPVPPPGSGWILITDNCPTDATYAREPQVGTLFDQTLTGDQIVYQLASVYGYTEGTSIPSGVSLSGVLDTYNTCGYSIVSDFFGISPDMSYPSGDVYTSALANLQNVLIFQKSDVKRPDAAEQATVGTWTYQKLLDSLKEQFNVKWQLDGSTLRIEHVSYFSGTSGIDLTAGAYASRILGLHAYSADNAELSRQERWFFMEDTSKAFLGSPIVYSSVPYDAEDEKPHDLGEVNNDVRFIQENTDSVSDNGFTFVNSYYNSPSGTYSLISEDSAAGYGIQANGHLSIPNLLDAYHRHERLLPAGTLNGTAVTFDSTVRRKRQVDLQVLMDNATFQTWDAGDLVKTQMGWGKVVRYRYDAKTCLLTLTLSHE